MRRRLQIAVLLAGGLVLQLVALIPTQAGPAPMSLQVTPENDRNPVTEIHRLTATVSPAPPGGAEVDFKILKGPNAQAKDRADNVTGMTQPDMFCTIRVGESSCFVEWGPSRGVGTDEIIAWVDADGENITAEADVDEMQDAGGAPDEPDCPEQNCGDDSLAQPGATAEPDATDVVLKSWGQLGAQRPPFIDGGTEQLEFACATRDARVNGSVAGVARRCGFAYLAFEAEEAANWAASWVQTSVDPKKGWCVARNTTTIETPAGSTALDSAPLSNRDLPRRRVLKTGLVIGPQGMTERGAYLEQHYIAYPGKLTTDLSDGGVLRVKWRGKTKKTVALVGGLEVSWGGFDPFPDFQGTSKLSARLVRC